MEEKQYPAILSAAFLPALVFLSNFIDGNIFAFGDAANFAAWFTLSFLCFLCGYFLHKKYGWQQGSKQLFGAVIASLILSLAVVLLFKEYFRATGATGSNLLLFALRNLTLGAMGYFGLAYAEVLSLQHDVVLSKEKLRLIEETIKDAKNEASLTVRDAQIKANKIINEAELSAKNILLTKERVEKELREFIQIEKELIKKYEEVK